MLEPTKALARWLSSLNIDPYSVSIDIRFKNERDCDKAGLALSKEFDGMRMVPVGSGLMHDATVLGIALKLTAPKERPVPSWR